MDVKRIPLYSGILLMLSTLLFVVSILIPDFYSKVPHIYILNQIVLPISGVLVLSFTYVFAIMSYYRELFTAEPPRIKATREESGEIILKIRPYILDKNELQIFIESIRLIVSHNYEIAKIEFNAKPLVRIDLNKDNEYLYELNKNADIDSTITVVMRDNGKDTDGRFLRFIVSYKKGKKWFNIKYDETHTLR